MQPAGFRALPVATLATHADGGPFLITCKKLLAELSNYLDDELDAVLKRDLEIHLKACPECWVVCDTTRMTIEIFRGNDPYPLPEDVHTRLTIALRRKVAERRAQQ